MQKMILIAIVAVAGMASVAEARGYRGGYYAPMHPPVVRGNNGMYYQYVPPRAVYGGGYYVPAPPPVRYAPRQRGFGFSFGYRH